MNTESIIRRIIETITKKNTIAIVLPAKPTADGVSAALALYLAITKLGKNVTIACASAPISGIDIDGVDKIGKNLASGGDDLVISFPYEQGSVDKVTYTIEGNRFNLLVIPREGYPRIDPEQVEYSYSGGKVDAVIVLDAANYNTLGSLYEENKKQFEGKDVINIDRHLTNANFGTINLVLKNVSSTSEIVLNILSNMNVQLDKEISTALYNGISAATNNFTSYSVNAQTMEMAAYLLKSGAVKKNMPSSQPQSRQMPQQRQQMGGYPFPQMGQGINNPFSRPMPRPSNQQPAGASGFQPPQYDMGMDEDYDSPQYQQPVRNMQPAQQPQPFQQNLPEQPSGSFEPEQPPESKSQDQDLSAVENKQMQAVEGSKPEKKPAPKEWLKPKIFKGSNLV